MDRPLQVFKPAILPDDNVLYGVLAVEVLAALAGLLIHKPQVVMAALMFMAALPGMPLFFHTLFHVAVKVELFDDRLAVTSYLGSNVIRSASRQEIFYREIACVYYLETEIHFLRNFCNRFKSAKGLSRESDFTYDNLSKKYPISREEYDARLKKAVESLPDPNSRKACLLRTKLNLHRYLQLEKSAHGNMATARTKACLVFSNSDGSKKVYFANLYDMSGKTSRGFLALMQQRNPGIEFLMNPLHARRLLDINYPS